MSASSKARTMIVLILLVTLFAACRTDEVTEAEDRRPGAVILITVDGLIPSELGLFGGDVAMPALESIAARGGAWDEAWTAAPMTRPGAATYLTGLAPDRHRVRDDLFSSLDVGVPTLATAFSEAGFETAAFPDSSFLGESSGLLRGFEIVADPPRMLINAARWHPSIRPPAEVAADFGSWLGALPDDARYFAWLHFSGPLALQLWEFASDVGFPPDVRAKQARRKDLALEMPPGAERLDAALASILGALESRGEVEDTMIVVAGTQGDVTGRDEGLAGQGFSVAPSAVEVPVILGWSGVGDVRSNDQSVWAPDVTATIARAVDLELSQDAEGASLLGSVADDRILFAWAWAALDQMGWHAQRAARSGTVVRAEGMAHVAYDLEDPAREVSQADAERLAEALAGRAEPAAPGVPLERVRPILEARGLTLRPVPSEGRAFADAPTRHEVSKTLLAARSMFGRRKTRLADTLYEKVLSSDPENLAGGLDVGQIMSVRDTREARRLLGQSLELYPTNAELLHWYAHTIWPESWEEAEGLIELILPFKPQDGDVLYDLACTRSLSENLDGAEELLRRAIESGYREFDHMQSDPDMRNMRTSGRLSEVLKDYQ